MIDRKAIDDVNALLKGTAPKIEGTWAIEQDEEGYEIAVLRGKDGQPRAWMNPDDYRAMAKEAAR